MSNFNGDGFKDDEFEPTERAGIRQMWHVLNRDYVPLDTDTADKMKSLANIVNAAVTIAKIVPVLAALGVIAAWYVRSGGFG